MTDNSEKELFYRKADNFLLKIGEDGNNYFNPSVNNIEQNKNWNWLKTYAEKVVEDMSAEKRKVKLTTKDRHLKEIEYYINRYIFENKDQNIKAKKKDINSEDSYMIVYNYLKEILEKQFLNINDENKKNIQSVAEEDKKTIDQFVKHEIIKTKSSGKQDELSVYKDKLNELNEELNNYNYDDTNQNELKNIDFSINNYIYDGKDKDIKLLNIQDTYQNFLKDKGKLQVKEESQVETGQIGSSTQAKLKNLILSIKNRHNMIQKPEQEQKINVYQGYITRGVFFYYKSILDELVIKLNKTDIIQNDHIYLPITISIMIYDIIFKYIYNNMTDEQVINFKELNKGQNDMSKFATLFYVEMKPFLDQYKACDSTQKVKVFCNINDNEGALTPKKYKVNSDIITKIKTKIPIGEESKSNDRVFSIVGSDNNKYNTLKINTDTFNESNDNESNDNKYKCEPFEVYFNKVFDKTKPQVMAPYIAASNVINNYEGLMLFTFGYSGVGKSFTIFGKDETPGVLSSIFSSIQNVKNVTVKIYEIYGMGLNKKEDFNNNVYYKYVNHEIGNNYNIDNSTVVDKLPQEGKTIKINDLIVFLKKLDFINNEIEERRGKIKTGKEIKYSTGELKDGDINIKTIKKTKNNPDSSRSILCYELKINKDEENIPFIIVDLPGKEIIKDSFGEEGEALLKINQNNFGTGEVTNTEIKFLEDNFSNTLSNIKNISLNDLKYLNEISIENNNISANIYKQDSNKSKTQKEPDTINIKFDKLKITGNPTNLQKFNEIIKFIPNFFTLSQYHSKFINGGALNKKLIYQNNKKNIFLNITDTYSKEFEISNDITKIKKEIKFSNEFINYEYENLIPGNYIATLPAGFNENNYATINVTKIHYGINQSDFDEIHKIALESLNKLKLIKLFKNAISFKKEQQQPQQPQQPHPILKLTQTLDKINDYNYINGDGYKNNAEKCFRYTKSAEGIFINENINGIMQLMINKKGGGITDMKNIEETYDESSMFYNQKTEGNDFSFNNTLIYDNLYTQYEETEGLRKIDNMYAFFVVANISKNERIKQKLICNATKTNEGYKTDLGWECDEEALAKEREETLKKQKEEIAKDRKDIETNKNTEIEEIKSILKTKEGITKLISNKMPIKIKNEYFNNNEKEVKVFLQEKHIIYKKKKKNKTISQILNDKNLTEDFIKYLAEAIYNQKINKELSKPETTNKIEELKKNVLEKENFTEEVIQNFKQIDTNGDGRIDIAEFISAIKKIYNGYVDKQSIINYFNIIDTDKSGFITIQEFSEDMKKQSGQGGGVDDRSLYIREMCKTQIALFRELKDTINKIVNPS